MNQPQVVEVDPNRIKFSPLNPRKHQGSEFTRLKQSVKEMGIVQLPTVRVLPGEFYEVIDGEGRVRSSQEAGQKSIWVVSFGQVNDEDALVMLQASNTIRSFGLLAECRGLANIHRKGQTAYRIAKNMGIKDDRWIGRMISIGYFPDHILALMERDIHQHDGGNPRPLLTWSLHTITAILPLRQLVVGQEDPSTTGIFEGAYDYTEVERAARQIADGRVYNHDQLVAYVEERRRELFEQRFNEEVRKRLEAEIAQTRQSLEESYEQKLQGTQQQTAQRYEAQVGLLQRQYDDLQASYQRLVKDVAKRPEVIAQREQELQKKLKDAEAERTRFQSLQQQVQQEIQRSQQEAQKAIQAQLSEAIKNQRESMDQQLAQTKADIESYYAKRDQERQLKAETSIRQAVAHGNELLSQAQQSFLHLMSPGYIKGFAWLSKAEVASILAQIVAVERTLDEAREAIQEAMRSGTTVTSDTPVIEEGSAING